MGQEIVYCFKCQTRLLGSDFERGKAFRVGAQVACPDCVRDLLKHLPDPDAELERLKGQNVKRPTGSTARIPVVKTPSPESSARLRAIPRQAAPPPPPSKSNLPLVLGAAGGVLLLLVVIALVLSGGQRTPPNPVVEAPSPSPAPPKPTPSPLPAPVPVPGPAGFAKEFDEIDAQILPAMQQERLRDVALVLDAAKKRRENPEWVRGIDARVQKLDALARKVGAPLLEQAVAAARQQDTATVDMLRTRVSNLGVETLVDDFERAVAAASPTPAPTPPKPSSPKPSPPKPAPKPATPIAAWRATWTAALAPARSRNLAASLDLVQKAAAGLKDPAARKEAEEDLADLRLAADLLAELPKLLPRWTKGTKAKVEFIAETGSPALLEGVILDLNAAGLTIQAAEGTLDVPAGELSGAAVAALVALREKRPTDARALAVLGALDGVRSEALPAKYGSLPAPGDAAEAEARRLFWAAEDDFAGASTRGAAAQSYATLLEKRAGTAFVVRNKAFLEERLASTRDSFFFPDDLVAAGTFQLSGSSKVESFWHSTADAPGKAPANFLEAPVAVQPGQSYKAWVFAGGCCQEVFTFGLQGTGLSGPSIKNPRETVTAEPGGEDAVAVKPPASGLKKKHADHTGPKEPDRWAWLELGTLKFAEPGEKKLRLVTDQKGFSVAYLVVSATRSGPPRDTEVKDLLKSRPPVDLGPQGSILREIWRGIGGDDVTALTGHAKFKEGKPDESGRISHIDSWSMGNDYGCRIRGWVHPPATGDYTFWIASDDKGELWLSPDDTPARKQKIAQVNGAVGHRDWERQGNQKSSPQALSAGKRYYIEVLQKQGIGEEHVSVGWRLPDGTLERAIPPQRLSPWGGTGLRRTPRPSFRPVPPEGPLVKSAFVGALGGGDFEDAPSPRQFLRGFRYSLKHTGCLVSLQGLYLGAAGETEGQLVGGGGDLKVVEARPGYAVAGWIARGTDRLNAFKPIFMRISGSRLLPSDRYEGGWIGHRDGGDEVKSGDDGTPVLGLYGRAGGEIDGAGLLLLAK